MALVKQSNYDSFTAHINVKAEDKIRIFVQLRIVYYNQDRQEEAEAVTLQRLELIERRYGRYTPQALTAITDVAVVQAELNKLLSWNTPNETISITEK
jgi:hypothetical protein